MRIVDVKSSLNKETAAVALRSLPTRGYGSHQPCLWQRLQMLLGQLCVHRRQILLHQVGPLLGQLVRSRQ
jgi:hypothetical protein